MTVNPVEGRHPVRVVTRHVAKRVVDFLDDEELTAKVLWDVVRAAAAAGDIAAFAPVTWLRCTETDSSLS